MIFDTLNMCEFDIKRHVFVAEGWVPSKLYENAVAALHGELRAGRPAAAARPIPCRSLAARLRLN